MRSHPSRSVPWLAAATVGSLLLTAMTHAAVSKKVSQTPLPGESITDFEATPDGEHVVFRSGKVYTTYGTSEGDIFIAPIDGGESTLVSGTVGRTDAVSKFHIAPGGMTIMLDVGRQQSSSTPSHLYRASPTGGEPVLVLPNDGDRVDYGLSPDGESWLYETGGTVRAYQLDDGSVRDIADLPTGTKWSPFVSPAVSPNGELIGYVSGASRYHTHGELWVTPIAGGTPTGVSGGEVASAFISSRALFRFTPDSAQVVYGSSGKLYINAVTGGTPTQLNTPPTSHSSAIYDAVVNNDGTHVIYVANEISNNRRDVYSVSSVGGARTTLWTGNTSLTIDGLMGGADDWLVFRSYSLGYPEKIGTLWRTTSTSTTPAQPILYPGSSSVRAPVLKHLLTPDGRFIIFEISQGAYITPLEPGILNAVSISSKKGLFLYVPGAKLTPDGSKLLYRRHDYVASTADLYVSGIPLTWVDAGENVSGEVNGGVGFTGGVGFQFTGQTSEGVFRGEYLSDDDAEALTEPTFITPGDTLQHWGLAFTGTYGSGPVTVTLTYDEDLLADNLNEVMLTVFRQQSNGQWQPLTTLDRDSPANTITAQTPSLGPLALGLTHLLTGDANNDGVVDAADFLAVESNLGSLGTDDGLLLGDANDDGRVDGVDWLWVEQHFSAVWEPIAPQTPEPGTLVFLCALLCGATQRSRKCDGRTGVITSRGS